MDFDLEFILLHLSRDPFERPQLFRKAVCACSWMRRAYTEMERARRECEAGLRSNPAQDHNPILYGQFYDDGVRVHGDHTEEYTPAFTRCAESLVHMAPGAFHSVRVQDMYDAKIEHCVSIFTSHRCKHREVYYLIQGLDSHRVTLSEHDSSYRTREKADHIMVYPFVTHLAVGTKSNKQIGKITRYDPVAKQLVWVSVAPCKMIDFDSVN
jgi:hypothetical protein